MAVFVHTAELQSGTMNKIDLPGRFLYMNLQTGTAAARQRGAAATSEPGPGGSGPAALLPGTLVTGPGGSADKILL